jgi:glycine cleavage system aminomethyltransferase T
VAVEENPGILLYTRIRKSPYFHASRQHGVRRYSVYNHAYHPRHYGDPVREYWTLLEGVTMWDVGVERQIEISGPDAFTFTNMMTPRDLSKCAVRQAKYAFITLPDGGIANDPVLLRLEENRFWLSLADSDVGLWAQGLAYHSPSRRDRAQAVHRPGQGDPQAVTGPARTWPGTAGPALRHRSAS